MSLKTANGSTALHNAATNGHDAIVEALLVVGSSVNARAVSGATPLFGAASGGHLTVVRRLLDAGAEASPALYWCHMQIVSMYRHLACRTCPVSTPVLHCRPESPDLAAASCHSLLPCSPARAPLDPPRAVQSHCRGRVLAHVQSLTIHRALLRSRGTHPGHDSKPAGSRQHSATAWAQVDAATTAASTPLAAAAGQGHTQVVRALLLAGANVDTQAQNGSTPLHSAASGGHADCLQELAAAGCDLDIQNSNSNTAMHVAAAKGAPLTLTDRAVQSVLGVGTLLALYRWLLLLPWVGLSSPQGTQRGMWTP